jgi:hypothetical protein
MMTHPDSTADTLAVDSQGSSIEHCLGKMRWFVSVQSETEPPRLQQLWRIDEYRVNGDYFSRIEWRDLPIEIVPPAAGDGQ